VTSPALHIPENIEALRAAYIASQEALIAERAGRAAEQAALASAENTIAHLKKLIARLQHDRYGASSERSRKLVDQLELQLAELTTAQSEAKTKAEINCLASTQPSQNSKQDKANRTGSVYLNISWAFPKWLPALVRPPSGLMEAR
jgi:hypothetical protein